MKRIFFSLFVSLFLASPVFAQSNPPPQISVYGTATTEVVPNEMLWSLNVQNKGPELETVATNHSRTVATVLAFLKDAGVNVKTIQSSRMSFGEDVEYENDKRVHKGYLASASIAFKLVDYSIYQKLWMGLAKIPGVSIENVAYNHTSRITYQNDTRQKALLIAREKARSLAAVVGLDVGEPLLIEEETGRSEMYAQNNIQAISSPPLQTSDVLAPGTISIQATIHATFKLEPKPK